MAAISEEALNVRPVEPRTPRLVRNVLYFSRRKPVAAASAVVLLVICTLVILAPLIAPYDPNAPDLSARLAEPSRDHLLGGDELGRDVWSRLLWGGRISLGAGLGATLVGIAAGVALGLISGYTGGHLDMLLQRLMDAIMALPPDGRTTCSYSVASTEAVDIVSDSQVYSSQRDAMLRQHTGRRAGA